MGSRSRVALAALSFSLPLLFLAACGVDGKTPDCSQPDSKCEPSAANANPDAHPDAQDGGRVDADAAPGADAQDAADASDALEAGDVKTDGDAKLDGDAKG